MPITCANKGVVVCNSSAFNYIIAKTMMNNSQRKNIGAITTHAHTRKVGVVEVLVFFSEHKFCEACRPDPRFSLALL